MLSQVLEQIEAKINEQKDCPNTLKWMDILQEIGALVVDHKDELLALHSTPTARELDEVRAKWESGPEGTETANILVREILFLGRRCIARAEAAERELERAKGSPVIGKPQLEDLVRPLIIDALLCRLRQDLDHGFQSMTLSEMEIVLKIVEAARACVREWEPSRSEKARGAGTGVGVRAAEDALIREMKQ